VSAKNPPPQAAPCYLSPALLSAYLISPSIPLQLNLALSFFARTKELRRNGIVFQCGRAIAPSLTAPAFPLSSKLSFFKYCLSGSLFGGVPLRFLAPPFFPSRLITFSQLPPPPLFTLVSVSFLRWLLPSPFEVYPRSPPRLSSREFLDRPWVISLSPVRVSFVLPLSLK